ncbi:hypothetical protein NPIL_413121 [Nephila pilipes]|uniref:Uncharacterized protein n=1 Tax=Nephila pilipes TaxID=299642 RepID=A0A8X6NKZ4_NEPPI|nr:hypothetical protein NPIL_413121 [Nephila pilipes]
MQNRSDMARPMEVNQATNRRASYLIKLDCTSSCSEDPVGKRNTSNLICFEITDFFCDCLVAGWPKPLAENCATRVVRISLSKYA